MGSKQQDKVLRVFDLQLDPSSHRVSLEEQSVEISATQCRFLKFCMSNQEKVFSRDHIQDAVWRGNVYLEELTTDVHIRCQHLVLSSVDRTSIDYAKLVLTVSGVSYLFCLRHF